MRVERTLVLLVSAGIGSSPAGVQGQGLGEGLPANIAACPLGIGAGIAVAEVQGQVGRAVELVVDSQGE